MDVVVDANVAAAALIQPDGWTATQLEREGVTWLAPAYLFEELEAHAAEYAGKAEVDLVTWKARVEGFRERVQAVPEKALLSAAEDPLVEEAAAVDPDDTVYLATVVAADADLLWTRDGDLLEAFEGLAVRVVPGEL